MQFKYFGQNCLYFNVMKHAHKLMILNHFTFSSEIFKCKFNDEQSSHIHEKEAALVILSCPEGVEGIILSPSH
jgi:hypothetical protein